MEIKEYSIVSNNTSEESTNDLLIYNIKLTDELIEKLAKGQKDWNNLQGIEFIHSDKGNDLLKIGNETFPFMKVKETQPVHLLSNPSKSSTKLNLLGSISHKLNPKLELEASKAEAIRQRSQEAEKERLSRKTVELEVLPAGNCKGQKRLIKRRPSVTSSTSSIVRTTSLATNSLSSQSNSIPLRTRIIQILAIGPISIDQLILKLNNNTNNNNNNNVKPILNEVCCEFDPNSLLKLNPELFGEVKVTEWPYYSMREREIVSRNIQLGNGNTLTPPETPETPKKQTTFSIRPSANNSSVPSSTKKAGASVKDRLNAIMKRRK